MLFRFLFVLPLITLAIDGIRPGNRHEVNESGYVHYASIPPMIVSKFTNPSPPPMINIQICYRYVSALARLKVLARVALRGVRHDKLTCITHS